MPKDYAKFVPPKSRLNLPRRWPVKFVVAVALLLLLAGIAFFYYSVSHTELLTKISGVFHPQKAASKDSEKLASAQPAKPHTVRFDFYEQLPNMQMPADTTAIPSMPAPVQPAAPVLAAVAVPAPRVAAPAIVAPAAPRPAFNPDELTHMLEAQRPKIVPVAQPAPRVASSSQFIIQMGDFGTEAGAKGLLRAIRSVGFDGKVVKISRGGRTIYQVQQGPYDSLALASQSQQRMQKRGLTSNIVKAM